MARKVTLGKKLMSRKAAESGKEVLLEYTNPQAKKVTVAGTFNSWDANSLLAKKDRKGNWTVKVALNPGRYEYKFVVDGSWVTDPVCKENISNTVGSANSVVVVR